MGMVIRAAAITPRPWPNGLGITRDVAGQNQRGALTAAIFCARGTFAAGGAALQAGDTITGTGATLIRTADAAAMALIVGIKTLGPA